MNPHYLDHVMAVSATHRVQATEDVVARNGMKLLARGAVVDEGMRERLLEHKLQKPLEDCVEVVGGVIPARFGPIAEELLERHPVLPALCTPGPATPVPATLAGLRLSMPVQSLLTVYASYKADRLGHTVGVAMLALALARRLMPGDVGTHRTLALAGLVHDVGELYIDPAFLRADRPLDAAKWRHVVSHPVVGHRVLRGMPGAGKEVAEAVLQHHERLDGFGYPQGLGHRALPLAGQVLAVSEWLMALVESNPSPLGHARLAAALMPGEFHRDLLGVLASAARSSEEVVAAEAAPLPLEEAIARARRIADTVQRFHAARPWIDERLAAAGPALRGLLLHGLARMRRICQAFSRTGLDIGHPEVTLRELAALPDPWVQAEVSMIVRELGWRLRELERAQLLGVARMSGDDQAVVAELIGRVKPPRPGAGPAGADRPLRDALAAAA
ncbi:MAG TPA: HD domain-containing phosphohydrolase, partial [Burkholderiaceae bacterium]